MALTFLDPRPASSALIDAFESRLGLRLPLAFRELLISVSNGGEIEPATAQSAPAVGLRSVLGVAREDHLDLEARIDQYGRCRLPEGLLPIGDAEGGNLVCLSLRFRDFGAVWFWDHERELEGDAITFLAPGLSEFLDDLGPISQPDEPSAVSEAWIDPTFLTELEEGD